MKPETDVYQRFHSRKCYRKSRWIKSRERVLKRIGLSHITPKIGPFWH